MNVTVKLFAAARDTAGKETVAVELDGKPTVAQLRGALAKQFPELANVLAHSMFAIETEFSSDDREIPAGATVACIPPVSGG